MAVGYGDILLDQNNDIITKNGDIVVEDAPEQQLGAILNAQSGNFRRWPTLGANLADKVNGPFDSRDIFAAVSNALRLDGWRLDNIDLSDVGGVKKVTIKQAVKITDETNSLV